MRVKGKVGALAAVLALGAGGCSTFSDTAAVTVNGVEISRDSLERELDAASELSSYRDVLEAQVQSESAGEGEGTFDSGFVAGLLTLRVYFQLVEQALVDEGATVADDDLLAARERLEGGLPDPQLLEDLEAPVRDDLIRRFALIEVIGRVLGGVTDEAAQQRYDEDPSAYDEACVSHILVSTENRTPEEARARVDELAAQLAAGADFAELATTQSDDPGASAAAGDLDCGGRGRFAPAFDEAVFTLPVGQVSAPVQTDFGFHLILVRERRTMPFAQVKETIERELAGESGTAVAGLIVRSSCAADVEVNVRYGLWDVEPCQSATASPARVVPSDGLTPTTVPPAVPVDGAPPGQ